MTDTKKPIDWHPMDLNAASQLTKATDNPGVVYPFDIKDAPKNLVRMQGLCSYYASAYIIPKTTTGEVTIGGEQLIGRTHGDELKNYLYYFASSSDNKVYFAGPFIDFEGHHIKTSSPVKVETLFGHGPLSERTKP
jgi:hypothetical protein